jgi:endonuclease/exonuclease/phosphatase family metal-dependent hydrolase
MTRSTLTRSTLTRSCMGLLGLAVCSLVGCNDSPTTANLELAPDGGVWTSQSSNALRVLTWNAYLGGDTGPLFSLDFTNVPAVLAAVNTFWAQVKSSDIPARMAAIADEIERTQPHVVSLQEVVQFGVLDMTTGEVVGGADQLATLEAELADRGLPYELVAVQANTSSALPLEVDFDVEQNSYATAFPLGPITLKRGYIRASFRFDHADYHVVNTHLETQGLAPIQAGQANELINDVMGDLTGVTILTGDLNSDAEAGPGDPSYTPTYELLMNSGFADAWELRNGPRQTVGYTCCQDPDLRNGTSVLDERIDFMLIRVVEGGKIKHQIPGAIHMEVVGDEQDDRVGDDGLWPADHAGLAALIQIVENRGG